eukprot:4869889-Amphidinium_carterae.1
MALGAGGLGLPSFVKIMVYIVWNAVKVTALLTAATAGDWLPWLCRQLDSVSVSGGGSSCNLQ